MFSIIEDLCFDISIDLTAKNDCCSLHCIQSISEVAGLDIYGRKPEFDSGENFQCSNCDRLVAPSRFAPHLGKCMGMGRNSKKRVFLKMEADDGDEEEDEFSDFKRKNPTKKIKKMKKKKDEEEELFGSAEDLFPNSMSKYVSLLDNEFIDIE